MYANGKLLWTVSGRLTTLSNMTGEQLLGQGSQNSFFTGEISELLVYDRALTDAERQTVERYLLHVVTPWLIRALNAGMVLDSTKV